MAINSFKQALHLPVATAQDYDVFGIGEVGRMDVCFSLNSWIIEPPRPSCYLKERLEDPSKS